MLGASAKQMANLARVRVRMKPYDVPRPITATRMKRFGGGRSEKNDFESSFGISASIEMRRATAHC